MEPRSDKTHVVARFTSVGQAELAASVLESEGIRAMVSPPAGPEPGSSIGLLVLEGDRQRARHILADIGIATEDRASVPASRRLRLAGILLAALLLYLLVQSLLTALSG